VIPTYTSRRGSQAAPASLSASLKFPLGSAGEAGPPWMSTSGGRSAGAGIGGFQGAGRGAQGGLGASYPGPADGAARAGGSAGGEGDHAAVAEGLPPVEDLLARVMSDVRPWGKRSNNSSSIAAGRAGSRPGMFVKSQASTTRS
jgi:hypothetical protein